MGKNDFILWFLREIEGRNLGYTQLAKMAGVSQGLLSGVLTGKVAPSCDFCIKVAAALDVSPIDTLTLAGHIPTDSPQPLPPEKLAVSDDTLQAIVDAAQQLPPAQKQQVLDFCRFLLSQ